MIRNLKVLGLALAAVFALSAVAASAASAANGKITSTGPVTLVGEEDGTNALTSGINSSVVECPTSIVTGHATLTTAQTEAGSKHEPIPSGASSATVTPHYVGCKALSGTEEHKATVTMNGCDYDITVGETIEPDVYKTTAALVCPTGKDVEIDVFAFAGSELGGAICHVTIEPQSGLTGAHIKSITASEDLTFTGAYENIHSTTTGVSQCGTGTSTTDKLDVNYTVKGRNAASEPTGVKITDEP